mgnify:CR=1 FL=1
MYLNDLEWLRQQLIGADERARLGDWAVKNITVEHMIRLNEMIEEGEGK